MLTKSHFDEHMGKINHNMMDDKLELTSVFNNEISTFNFFSEKEKKRKSSFKELY